MMTHQASLVYSINLKNEKAQVVDVDGKSRHTTTCKDLVLSNVRVQPRILRGWMEKVAGGEADELIIIIHGLTQVQK